MADRSRLEEQPELAQDSVEVVVALPANAPMNAKSGGQVLDRQGFGTVFYQGQDRILRTAEDLAPFTVGEDTLRTMTNTGLRKYYQRQNDMIQGLQKMENHLHKVIHDVRENKSSIRNYHVAADELDESAQQSEQFWKRMIPWAVFSGTIVNLCLASINIYISLRTNSLSVIASTADTVVDLVTSTMFNITSRYMAKKDPYNYPGGKARLEPIVVLIFAVIMGMVSFMIVFESVNNLVAGLSLFHENSFQTERVIMISVVFMFNLTGKFFVIGLNRYVSSKLSMGSSICITFAQEQSYDLLTYISGFSSAILSSAVPIVWFLDPTMAILISCYVASRWLANAKDQIRRLAGKSASPEYLAQLTYLALRHDKRIKFIDDVKAVHFGDRFMVEIHIVLDENMILKESHDIGESLQIKLETLDTVEIAHVHADYMYCHLWKEHKDN